MRRNLTVADLFAGVGGATLAFRRAGFEPVFASEICQRACDTYEANHRHRPFGDIAAIDPGQVPSHDVTFIGLPCVGFSSLGRRHGFDDVREAVWLSALRVLLRKRPRVAVVENVLGLVHHDRGRSLRFLTECLRAVGYRVAWQVLDATRFGGAQVRRRVFVVASRGRRFTFDRFGTAPPGCIRTVLAPQPSDRYLDPATYRLLDRPHRCRSGPVFVGYRPGKPRWVRELPPTHPRAHQPQNRIYSVDGPSPTVTTRGGGNQLWVLTDAGVRPLNHREWGRLMGYPDNFIWPHPTRIRKQLGNSVHLPTVEALAHQIREQFF